MPFDPYTGEWVQPNGVPDPNMPAGMGSMTGMATQSMPPMRGELTAPPPPMGMNYGIQPNSPYEEMLPGVVNPQTGSRIPPPLPTSQIQQQYEANAQPQPWGIGRGIGAVLGAPLNLLHGLDQGIKGTLGLPTVAGAAARGRALYGNPRSESRAFGRDVAEEPDFGDHVLGALTGSSRRDMNAAFMTAMQVHQYNAQRKAALGTIKDVQNLYKNELGIGGQEFTNRMNNLYGEQKEQLAVSRGQAGLTGDLLGNEKLARELARIRAEEAARAQVNLGAVFPGGQVPPGVPQTYEGVEAYQGLAGPAITQGQGAVNLGQDLANPVNPATGQLKSTETTQGLETGRSLADDARAEAARIFSERNDQKQRNTAVDVLRASPERDWRGPDVLWEALGMKPRSPSEVQDFAEYDADTRRMQAEAYRARGLSIPADLLAPTTPAAPLPSPTPLATPGTTQLGREYDQLRSGALAGPTVDMPSEESLPNYLRDVPAPQATRVQPELLPGRDSERARQEMRNKVGDKKSQWQDSWKRAHPNDPIGGELERGYYKNFLRKNNLIDESAQ